MLSLDVAFRGSYWAIHYHCITTKLIGFLFPTSTQDYVVQSTHLFQTKLRDSITLHGRYYACMVIKKLFMCREVYYLH